MGVHFCILETPHNLKKEKENEREKENFCSTWFWR